MRPYQPADRLAAMALAPRLSEGVAPWRDSDAVRSAVAAWVEGSLDSAQADDRAVFVAESHEGLVGLVTVGERCHWAGDLDGYVGELVVAAAASRRGVGALLMSAAEDWAKARGLAFLTLETGAANHAARAFYAALGYQVEDVRLTKQLA